MLDPRRPAFSILLRAELVRTLRTMLRYPVNHAAGLVFLFAFFVVIVCLASLFGVTQEQRPWGEVLVGYACWMVITSVLSHVQAEVQADNQTGVLESVMTSTYGAIHVFVARLVASLAPGMLTVVVLIVAVQGSLRLPLHASVVLALPVTCLILTYAGFGLVLAGLALVYKRVEALLVPVYLLLAFTFSYGPIQSAANPASMLAFVPGFESATAIYGMVLRDATPSPLSFAVQVVTSLAFLALGLCGLSALVTRARRLARIGTH